MHCVHVKCLAVTKPLGWLTSPWSRAMFICQVRCFPRVDVSMRPGIGWRFPQRDRLTERALKKSTTEESVCVSMISACGVDLTHAG